MTEEAKKILLEWLSSNIDDLYPKMKVKIKLAHDCKLPVSQINKWLCNQRRKLKRKRKLIFDYKSIEKKMILEKFFEKKQYPDHEDILQMIENTGKTRKQIRNWFKKQRYVFANRPTKSNNIMP